MARRPWLQKEASGFDGSQRKHIPPRAECRFLPGEGAAAHAGGAAVVVPKEFDGIGVEPELDAGIVFEAAAMQTRKVRLRAPTGQVEVEIGEAGRGFAEHLPYVTIAGQARVQAFYLKGTRVKRGEVCFAKGPAAARDPGMRLEVGIFKLQDLPAPLRGGAAMEAEAAFVDPTVWEAGEIGAIQALRGLLGERATSFQKKDVLAQPGEFNGEADARSARAYDQDVGHAVMGG